MKRRSQGWSVRDRVRSLIVIAISPICSALLVASVRAQAPSSPFRFREVNDKTSLLVEQDHQPILVYNHGPQHPKGAPVTEARSSYIHPLYGLDGEVLTDDAPADHLHHRGVFWAWPHVTVAGRHHDSWILRGIAPRFERFGAQECGPESARLELENGWYVATKKVMSEALTITVHKATSGPGNRGARAIDLDFTWMPVEQPVTLGGAEGKSYGGLTMRFASGADTAITVPTGRTHDDLYMTKLPWADLTRVWSGQTSTSGAAIFVHPSHPDYPPTWLTRHYGALCLGWPGVQPKTLRAGEAIRCRYRIWIHRGRPVVDELGKAYAAYVSETAKAPIGQRVP